MNHTTKAAALAAELERPARKYTLTDAHLDEAATLLRALAARVEAMGWRPIETAPKETEILVWFGPNVGVKSALYTEAIGPGIWSWCVDDEKFGPHPVRRYCSPYPTHWQPLPTPPHPSEQEPAK